MLLGDNTVGGAVMLQRIRFLCFGVGCQPERLVYTHAVDRLSVYSVTIAQNSSFALVPGTLLLHKSGSVWTDWERI